MNARPAGVSGRGGEGELRSGAGPGARPRGAPGGVGAGRRAPPAGSVHLS